MMYSICVGPENIHTPPTEGIGIPWLGGGGFCKTQKFKMYEAYLEFPEG